MKKQIRYRRDFWQLLEDLPGNAAELGIAEGRYSKEILEWPIKIPKLYLVDRWSCDPDQKGDGGAPQEWHDSNFEKVDAMLQGFPGRYQVLRGDSDRMASFVPNKSLRFVYIDCDHSYDAVMRDIQAWYPKLVPSGLMAFHDYANFQYGVGKAVGDYCAGSRRIWTVEEDAWQDAGAYFYAT